MIRDSVLVILPLGGSLSKNVSMLSISSSVVGVTDSGCSCWTTREEEADSRSQMHLASPFTTNIKDVVDSCSKNSQKRRFQTFHHQEIWPPDICFYLGQSVNQKKKKKKRSETRRRLLVPSEELQSLRPVLLLSPESDFSSVLFGCAGKAHRAGGVPVTPDAVDAADLRLRAGQRDALEVRPERERECEGDGYC